MLIGRCVALILWLAAAQAPALAQQQIIDPAFSPSVAKPAYAKPDYPKGGPVVAIDEAHANRHTLSGNYKPFGALLSLDGYRMKASASKLSAETFKDVDVFVIVNATEPFTDAESDALRDWVAAGGSLLLTADHAPYGAATELLSRRFDVSMGKGWAYDSQAPDTGKPAEITTNLDYSRANKRLGDHPITRGRDRSETINLVRTFTGQSLGLPPSLEATKGATALLIFSPTAREAPTTDVLNAAGEAFATGKAPPAATTPIAGRVQGLAMPFGKGRVVVLGEAGMFSAQVVKFPPGSGQADIYFGMQVPGTDDRQFALNVMHWLSGALK